MAVIDCLIDEQKKTPFLPGQASEERSFLLC